MNPVRGMLKLEPMRRFVVLAVLGHLLLAVLVWWWIQIQRFSAPRLADASQLSWMETAEVGTTIQDKPEEPAQPANPSPPRPAPPPIVIRSKQPAATKEEPEDKPVPKAILIRPPDKPTTPAPSSAVTTPPPSPAPGEVSRFVTVSRIAGTNTAATGLDTVDRALIDSFLKAWTAPKLDRASASPGAVLLEVALDRAGMLASFKLVQPSGDKAVDASVLEAADRLEKIGESLPASFVGERYPVQVRFHVE